MHKHIHARPSRQEESGRKEDSPNEHHEDNKVGKPVTAGPSQIWRVGVAWHDILRLTIP